MTLVDDHNLAPEDDDDWIVFREMPWCWAMVLIQWPPVLRLAACG